MISSLASAIGMFFIYENLEKYLQLKTAGRRRLGLPKGLCQNGLAYFKTFREDTERIEILEHICSEEDNKVCQKCASAFIKFMMDLKI